MLSPNTVSVLNRLFADELEVSGKIWTNININHWESPVGNVEIGAYRIVPLITHKKVKSEGYLMRSCVRQYIDLCQNGGYLLFSIRNSGGERVATLGVKKRDDRWYYDDCLGKENSTIVEASMESFDDDNNIIYEIEYTDLFSVAHEVVRLLNFQAVNSKEV